MSEMKENNSENIGKYWKILENIGNGSFQKVGNENWLESIGNGPLNRKHAKNNQIYGRFLSWPFLVRIL